MSDLHAVTHRVDIDHAAVRAGHVRRLAAIDPLITVPPFEVEPDDAVLVARAGDAAVVARARQERHAAASQAALWGALHQLRLSPFAVGDDIEVAWERLLNRWCGSLPEHAEPGDTDAAAIVSVASHDTVFARPLAHHGFAPLVCIAVRHRRGYDGANEAARTRDGRPRPMEYRDVPQVVDLAVALQRHDARFGMVSERDAARDVLRASFEDSQRRSPGWSWVVELANGRIAGFVRVEPPEQAGWVSSCVAVRPVAYLSDLYVVPSARRAGIGAALVRTAHSALDAADIGATLLHHALPSALSAPFWARHGYRPLWTSWQRRPAVPVSVRAAR